MTALSITETGTIRDRLVAAATELTTTQGWASVTMARLAETVGVSRQTVYNEIGTKTALAEAMILGELARFLERVDTAFLAHPDDLGAAVHAAVVNVLDLADGNDLIKAIVSATHGADTELLPLLTTHSSTLLQSAGLVIGDHLAAYDIALEEWQFEGAVDAIIRVVLSHVMQPTTDAEKVADTLSWMATRILART